MKLLWKNQFFELKRLTKMAKLVITDYIEFGGIVVQILRWSNATARDFSTD